MHVAEKFVSRRKESEKSISDANSFVCSNAKQKKKIVKGSWVGDWLQFVWKCQWQPQGGKK